MLCHVIEHLTTPHRFLQAVRRHLADDGALVVVTPNYASVFYRILFSHPSFMRRFYSYDPYRALSYEEGVPVIAPQQASRAAQNWFRMLEFEHTLQFSAHSLTLLLAKNGFARSAYPTGNSLPLPPEPLSAKALVKKAIWSKLSNSALKTLNLQNELCMVFRKT